MSNVPANASTTAAHTRSPRPVRKAAPKVSSVPTTVIWFGVTGRRPRADISASARRRTQASNLVVNIAHLRGPAILARDARGLARLAINVDHLRGHAVPRVPARLVIAVGAEPAAQLRVPGQDHQRRAQLRPALRPDRE